MQVIKQANKMSHPRKNARRKCGKCIVAHIPDDVLMIPCQFTVLPHNVFRLVRYVNVPSVIELSLFD